jgi:uncharacterized protein (DUF4415 family)
LLALVYTVRGEDDDIIRLISARKPDAHERAQDRLDAEVLNFFRKAGQRYQSRINAALREYMNAHRKPE